jgi:hypothetical protein
MSIQTEGLLEEMMLELMIMSSTPPNPWNVTQFVKSIDQLHTVHAITNIVA